MNLLLKQNLLLMIRALYFCAEEQWANLGEKYKISPAQQHILFLLVSNNKLTPTEISQLGCWHISTVTRLLKPLHSHGLVDISRDRNKPKFKNVTITLKGIELFNELVTSVQQMETFPLDTAHLTSEELDAFLQVGQQILKAHKGESFNSKVINAKVKGIKYV
ncbi:MarR family winged helix-turn-helix transcriptional regulator [Alkalihalobacillus deserti]|uniref:MarR family winged helix-turn-helix transcriptional regulator n=1 Tax=Alkalihalobacillus deserti TaxID=2879466 RepID=UPI001D158D06|nr:MarR family transcriptional regulator [Alkalihalobacillus deserti]